MGKQKEKETITLTNPVLGEQEFEQSHAERILKFDADKGVTNWELHDSKLAFENGKIITRSSQGNI